MNRDPIEESGGFNLVLAVVNNPLMFYDALGLLSLLTLPEKWPSYGIELRNMHSQYGRNEGGDLEAEEVAAYNFGNEWTSDVAENAVTTKWKDFVAGAVSALGPTFAKIGLAGSVTYDLFNEGFYGGMATLQEGLVDEVMGMTADELAKYMPDFDASQETDWIDTKTLLHMKKIELTTKLLSEVQQSFTDFVEGMDYHILQTHMQGVEFGDGMTGYAHTRFHLLTGNVYMVMAGKAPCTGDQEWQSFYYIMQGEARYTQYGLSSFQYRHDRTYLNATCCPNQ